MIKKIFAIVSENDFYKFRAKCDRENYTMGEAMTTIVHHFANGRSISLPRKIGKKPVVIREGEEKQE